MKRKILLLCILLTALLFAVGALVGCGFTPNDSDDSKGFHFYYCDVPKNGFRPIYCENGPRGRVLELANDMTRDGYQFEGAYTEENGQGEKYIDQYGYEVVSVYKGLRLYANWTPKKYTLVLLVGDEEFKRIQDITYMSELTVLDVPTDLIGCTFAGWGLPNSSKSVTDSNGVFTEGHTVFEHSSGFLFDENTNTVKLVAVLDYDVYDVTLNYNGLKDNQTLYITYNSTITKLPDFEPSERYEFIGWSYVNSSVDYALYDDEAITEPITLYAIVLRYRDFDIFDGDNNKLATKRVYDNGETVRLSQLELELPAGYQAGNWYNNSSMSGSSRITAVTYNTVTEALYVDIAAIEYTAQLVKGDATVNGSTRITYTCEDIVPLPTATKDNYSFLGWCMDEELTSAPVTRLQKGTTGNLTLYPKFKGVDVTFNLYPQNGGSQTSVTREYGQSFTLDVPKRVGYTFVGWYGSEEGGTRYTGSNGKGSKAIDFTEPLNLYAQWIINEYAVSYVDGDGNTITSQTYEHGQKLAFPSNPSKEGLMFSGWYNSGYSEPFTDGIKVTEDITVYALFVDSMEILTADQLKAIALNPLGNYHLGADINLLGETWTPINEFKGILDGKGHKIFNFGLALSSETTNFGFVRVNNGTIKNLVFDDFTYNVTVTMTNDVHYGVVSGSNYGLLFNCTVNNTAAINVNITYSDLRLVTENFFKVSRVGIISGINNGVITACTADVSVESNITVNCFRYNGPRTDDSRTRLLSFFGGISGDNYQGKIVDCVANVSFNVQSQLRARNDWFDDSYAENIIYMGGIAGVNNISSVVLSSKANVNFGNNYSTYGEYGAGYGSAKRNFYVLQMSAGGLIGINHGKLYTSYATGLIKCKNVVSDVSRYGGLVGLNEQNGEIQDCYSAAAVTFLEGYAHVGGFTGENSGKIQNCYSCGDINVANVFADSCIGGFCGYLAEVGLISGCISFSNMTLINGNYGRCIGYGLVAVRKCYFSSDAVLKVNGVVQADTTHGGGYKAVSVAKTESELNSRELLVDELFWDEEAWVIDGTQRPKLVWQD